MLLTSLGICWHFILIGQLAPVFKTRRIGKEVVNHHEISVATEENLGSRQKTPRGSKEVPSKRNLGVRFTIWPSLVTGVRHLLPCSHAHFLEVKLHVALFAAAAQWTRRRTERSCIIRPFQVHASWMHALVISEVVRRFAFLREEMFVCNNSYIDNICERSNCLKITIGQEDLLFAPVSQLQNLRRITAANVGHLHALHATRTYVQLRFI